MNILVTGNLGYIGSVLTRKLELDGYNVFGYDIGYYKNCLISKPHKIKNQIIKDIRKVTHKEVKHIDSVIHLAGLSNDPLGELNKNITEQVNYKATVRFAKICKKNGVRRFIFASSQSIYGIADTSKLVAENSRKNPITVYAKTKWKAEKELKKLGDKNFCVTFFRPSTVFGSSPRLRSDIVYNNFLGSAFTKKKKNILSDGKPWRPVIHVNDVCEAFMSALKVETKKINKQAFNIGIKNGNFTVKHIAQHASKIIKNSKIYINQNNKSDERTYKVSFHKIFRILGKFYNPKFKLTNGGQELVSFFKKNNFEKKRF